MKLNAPFTTDVLIESTRKKRFLNILVIVSILVIGLTLVAALWKNGSLLPSWVQWQSYAVRTDVNGNNNIETIKLANRHLSITDHEGNQYITPDNLLVMNAQFGDVTNDGTPEILMLVWKEDTNNSGMQYRLPLINQSAGFSQYLQVIDFVDGNIEELWTSQPLTLNAKNIYLTKNGQLSMELSSGTITMWTWDDPGFLLQDNNISGSMFVLIE